MYLEKPLLIWLLPSIPCKLAPFCQVGTNLLGTSFCLNVLSMFEEPCCLLIPMHIPQKSSITLQSRHCFRMLRAKGTLIDRYGTQVEALGLLVLSLVLVE